VIGTSTLAVPEYKMCKAVFDGGMERDWHCMLREIHTGEHYDPFAEQFWENRDGVLVVY
jgi:hypothetical protein